MANPRLTALLLAAWTAFVWVTRVRNVLGDDELGVGDQALGLLLSGSFLVLAGALVWATLRRPERRGSSVGALALWTVAVWAVRSVQIATGGHGVAFVVVHLLLGVVSVGLAGLALRASLGSVRSSSGAPASR